jgi:DNA-directed RNA polymerase specialized sigma subunit
MNKLIRTKHINLVRKIAWSFYHSTGIEWNELFSEAALAYCEAINTYETSKNTKISSYLWYCMKNRLINFCKKEKRYVSSDFDSDIKHNDIHTFEMKPICHSKTIRAAKLAYKNQNLYKDLLRKYDYKADIIKNMIQDISLLAEKGHTLEFELYNK